MRLYLLPVGTIRETPSLPIEAYVIELDDGTNVLVDTGPTRTMVNDASAPFAVSDDDHIVARLQSIGLTPAGIDQVVCTHLDPDHSGAHDEFPHAEFIVQERHLVEAQTSGHMRYEWMRRHWEFPGQRWRRVDGDTSLHPGVDLIESSGHVPGHQSVLIRLPRTGPVLLAGDAIAHHDLLDPATRTVGHHDHDEHETRASTRKLVELADAEQAWILHSHDGEQWATARHAPSFYD